MEKVEPFTIRDFIERKNEDRARSKTSFDWLPADAERRKELRRKIQEGGRQSLTEDERKEAFAHGLLQRGRT
jgi:hypothetical protein